MRASNAPFDEFGWAELIREVEMLRLKVEAGTNDLNAGAVAVDQVTADEVQDAATQAVEEHEDASDPHPQYLLAEEATEPASVYAMASSASVSITSSIVTISTLTAAPDPDGLFSSGVFTAPEAGYYMYTIAGYAAMESGTAPTLGEYFLYFQSGGVDQQVLRATIYDDEVSSGVRAKTPISVTGIIQVSAGAALRLRHKIDTWYGSIPSATAAVYFSVIKLN